MLIRSLLIFHALLILSTLSHAAATDVCVSAEGDRPSIGLVLGGGGARGSAHIGVIKALEEMRIPIDCVVGTSMGSLIGALYASGMSVPEMEETIGGIEWEELFNDAGPREDQPFRRKREDEAYALYGPKIGVGKGTSLVPTGLISGQKINFLFETLVSKRVHTDDFDDLALPFRAVATDLLTGDQVVLDRGNLARAMRASMSVPAVFDPVDWDGKLLVDGGLAANLPVDVARSLGADIVIAVDVGSEGLRKDEVRNMFSVVAQMTNLMISGNVEASIESLTEQDVLITPALPRDFSSAEFPRAMEAAGIGYTSTIEQRAEVEQLGLADPDYQRYLATVDRTLPEVPVIDFIALDNGSQFSDELILRQLHVRPGEPLNTEQLQMDLRNIYALGFLEMVRYEIVREDGRQGLNLYVREDNRGTRYLEWGLDLFSDDITNGLNFRLGYLMTDLDELGSEFRVMGQLGQNKQLVLDLYKYIDRSASWVVKPRVFAESREFTAFEDGEALGVNELRQWGGDLALGRELGRRAAVSAGVRGYTGSVKQSIGAPGFEDEDFDAGEYFAGFTYDRLDDRYIPDDGLFLRANYLSSASWLGSDDDYRQTQIGAIFATSSGPHTLLAATNIAATVDGVAPSYALFSVGGLYNLSGNSSGQLSGQNFGVVAGSYQHKFSRGFIKGRLGVSLEYGGITDNYRDLFKNGDVHGSIFTAFRTPIGPAYLGYGWGDGGAQNFFLKFGRIFGSAGVIR